MYPFNIGLVASSPEIWEQTHTLLRDLPVRIVFEVPEMETATLLTEKVDRYRPDILMLEVTAIEDLEEVFGGVLRVHSAPKVFALSTNSDPQQILAAVRAGASEFIFPPVAEPLLAALERMSRDHDRTGHSRDDRSAGRVIGFLSVKGGCGATTIACHAATEIQTRTGKDVLLADLDMDCGIVRFLMQAKGRYSVLDAMRNLGRLDANYWSGLVSESRPGLDIIGGPIETPNLADVATGDLRHVLRFLRENYPFVVADLGRGLDEFRMEALRELDDLVLVSTLDVPSLHRATGITKRILDDGFSSSRLRFVLNRVARNTDVEIEDVEKVLGLRVFESIADDYAPLEAAYRKGRLLSAEQPVRRRIGRLAGKLAGVEEPPPVARKRKFSLFSFDAKEAVS